MGFYSSVESNSFACVPSLFLIGKIFINMRIFQNPSNVIVPFVAGLYGLRLIVRRKLFPFRVSWRPYNDLLSVTWLSGQSTLGSFTRDLSTIGSFVKQSILLNESVYLMSIHKWSVHI